MIQKVFKYLALAILFISNPLFNLLYFIVYLYFTTNVFYAYHNHLQFIYLLGIIAVTTFILPSFSNYLAYRSLKNEVKNRNTGNLIIIAFFYLLLLSFSDELFFPLIVKNYIKIVMVCIVVITLIQFRIKVCFHSNSIGLLLSATGFLFSINPDIHFYNLIILIIIGGIVMSSKLFLEKSSVQSVIIGFITGFLTGSLIFLLS